MRPRTHRPPAGDDLRPCPRFATLLGASPAPSMLKNRYADWLLASSILEPQLFLKRRTAPLTGTTPLIARCEPTAVPTPASRNATAGLGAGCRADAALLLPREAAAGACTVVLLRELARVRPVLAVIGPGLIPRSARRGEIEEDRGLRDGLKGAREARSHPSWRTSPMSRSARPSDRADFYNPQLRPSYHQPRSTLAPASGRLPWHRRHQQRRAPPTSPRQALPRWITRSP